MPVDHKVVVRGRRKSYYVRSAVRGKCFVIFLSLNSRVSIKVLMSMY